jgi:O-antigen ligase
MISFTRFGFAGSRDIITYALVLLLYFLFLKEYGFNFKEYPRLPRPVLYFFILLLGTITISTICSKDTMISLLPWLRTLVFFSVCYIYYSFINKVKVVFSFLYMVILAQIVVGMSIFSEFVNSGFSFFLANGVLARFSGFYANPNIVGLIIVITTCIILGLFFLKDFQTITKRIILSILLLNNLLITILTDSRAAIIAMIFCGGFILFVFNKKVFIRAVIATIIFAFFLMLIPSVNELVTVLLRLESRSVRPFLWDSGYQIFLKNWLTGVGPEQFQYYQFTYLPSAVIQLLVDTGNIAWGKVPSPHSFPILFAAENGILGVISVLSLYVLYFYLNIKSMLYFKSRNKDLYILMITFFAAGVGIFWRSFFEISGIMNYGYMATDLPFWILMIVLTYIFKNRETLAINNNSEILSAQN